MFHKGLNKEIIVDAAKELIEQDGFPAFSMRRLAEKLNIKTASLYAHIESMDALFTEIGLTPREYNEFIVYWLPKMQDNPYNLISFQSEAYTDAAKLDIDPTPDSVLRVFMAWKPLGRPQTIEPQTFTSFARDGFTVVEWGGCEVK